jgi:hypothetical protein
MTIRISVRVEVIACNWKCVDFGHPYIIMGDGEFGDNRTTLCACDVKVMYTIISPNVDGSRYILYWVGVATHDKL